jgi:hypothetical protein
MVQREVDVRPIGVGRQKPHSLLHFVGQFIEVSPLCDAFICLPDRLGGAVAQVAVARGYRPDWFLCHLGLLCVMGGNGGLVFSEMLAMLLTRESSLFFFSFYLSAHVRDGAFP